MWLWNVQFNFNSYALQHSKKEWEWQKKGKNTSSESIENRMRVRVQIMLTGTHTHYTLYCITNTHKTHHLPRMECHLFLTFNLCTNSKSGRLVHFYFHDDRLNYVYTTDVLMHTECVCVCASVHFMSLNQIQQTRFVLILPSICMCMFTSRNR